jgi:hypothetical protein
MRKLTLKIMKPMLDGLQIGKHPNSETINKRIYCMAKRSVCTLLQFDLFLSGRYHAVRTADFSHIVFYSNCPHASIGLQVDSKIWEMRALAPGKISYLPNWVTLAISYPSS